MVGENGVPVTPGWSLPPGLHTYPNEALTLPLTWPGDQA